MECKTCGEPVEDEIAFCSDHCLALERRRLKEMVEQEAAEKKKYMPSKAEQKANEAAMTESAADMQSALATAFGISPLPALIETRHDLRRALKHDARFNTEAALRLWSEIGRELWAYGVKHGDDVSEVARLAEQLRAWEDEAQP